ncbi:SCO6880 family protein [Arthrobacter woluwensis]|uniref:PrgI family protein n=1 Tax=Arthrobacter woluwensis TaxID=156980 RepID=A0A1H4I816_9MICC|nr:SCO6880 family protein [Arthrobacter woluwensis]SEB30121.1 hypothetical protein SAMN04489745_0111 [Arthrobacter woluwensis]
MDLLHDEELDITKDARFSREERRGIVLGLEKHQLIALAALIPLIMILFQALGFPGSIVPIAIVVVICGPVICVRIQSKSLLQWSWMLIRSVFKRSARHHEHRAAAVEMIHDLPGEEDEIPAYRCRQEGNGKLHLGKPTRMNLPGELVELLPYELPGGEAFIYDPVNKLGIIAAKVSTENAFDMEAEEGKMIRTTEFASLLTTLSRITGIHTVQSTDQTSVVSAATIRDYYRSRVAAAPAGRVRRSGGKITSVERLAGAALNPFAHKAYEDLIHSGKGIEAHEEWIVFVWERNALDRPIRAKGGGLQGFMRVVMDHLDSLKVASETSGFALEEWMNLRQLSAIIRTAVDPAAAVAISERVGDHAGVAPEAAAPMAMRPGWDHVRTDTGFHRTWWISEWPKRRAKMGFLGKVIFAGDFRHTVTLVASPESQRKASKRIGEGLNDLESSHELQTKLGRRITLSQSRESEDLEFREMQLDEGYAPLAVGGYITVSGESLDEVEGFAHKMNAAATSARLDLRTLYNQQAEALVASAFPLGRGLL